MRQFLIVGYVAMLVSVGGVIGADDTPPLQLRRAPELAEKNWEVLYVPGRPQRNVQPLTEKIKLVPIDSLELTGPEPGHPFVMGEFATDGKWGIVEGGIQVVGGTNAVLELAQGDNLELEGRMAQADLGGWFLLVGWHEGHGYCISNVLMKESGAPWFLTEYRGGTAITETHVEFPSFEWQKEQPFRLTIENKELSLVVGAKTVFEDQPLPNYEKGAVLLGTYNTKYGPRALRLLTLRGRAIVE